MVPFTSTGVLRWNCDVTLIEAVTAKVLDSPESWARGSRG